MLQAKSRMFPSITVEEFGPCSKIDWSTITRVPRSVTIMPIFSLWVICSLRNMAPAMIIKIGAVEVIREASIEVESFVP